jgi:hypothetical protein
MVSKVFVAALVAAAALPASASAFVTPGAAQDAADRAVGWYETQQSPDGSVGAFGGDWSMIALANAGVNAADLRTGIADPSLQDFYYGSWAADGPGMASTDQSRALLVGRAGGIQAAKLSATRNILARQLRYFDGRQMGLSSTVNDDMFGLLALARNGVTDLDPALEKEVRRVQTGGGWNYTTSGGDPDTDVTGAGIATLCAAGAGPDDPAVSAALAYLKGMQDDATGGFVSDFFGVNSDSTAWAVNGLRECGIDPQSAEWTTASGKTPLDFLVAMQNDNGAFHWTTTDEADNLYSTQDAVTALVGKGFGSDPAPREDPTQPAFRPAPDVAAGTVVPMGLVIDHGPAEPGAERACFLDAPVGGTVAQLLANTAGALPEGCATDVRTANDELTSINGVAADAQRHWVVSVDGGEASATLDAPLALGSIVRATMVSRPGTPPAPAETTLPPVTPAPNEAPRRAKAKLTSKENERLALRSGRVKVRIACPRGLGAAGCKGVVRVTYKQGTHRRVAGRKQFTLRSGAHKTVRVKLSKRFRKLVARKARSVRIEAAVRDQATGSTTVARVRARVRR